MSHELAIRLSEVGKAYNVYSRPADRLKQMLWRNRRRLYQQFWAVRDVSLDIHRGETVGLVGRNGSGKSTLLQMICGTLQQTTGTVAVNGRVAALLELGAGFNPEFTGRENIVLNATILGLDSAEIERRMDDIIAFADIGSFIEQPVKSYSSGMYARLAFAVAINVDPDILVIDEALAVGDEAFQRKCFSRIRAIRDKGATVLFVSHSAGSVIELCDRAVLMDGGEMLTLGAPKTVVSLYQRLVYAPAEKQPELRQQIKDGVALARPAALPASTEASPPANADTEHFDPNLVPQSTIRYAERGGRIENVRILNREERQVNILQPGETYHYAYDVHFFEPAFGVRFAMMVKTLSGIELGGQTHCREGEEIDYVEAGAVVRVRFSFRALMLPGVYFCNAGTSALLEEGRVPMHRIVDALMFRIQPSGPPRLSGLVDISVEEPPRLEFSTGKQERAALSA